ncbi:MAG: hypothetical protein FWD57_12555, partial [Polyangiaceae bacterium]|nr:hypothetical protein [Polyangiaceae bacterium]
IFASWLERDTPDNKPFVWSDYLRIPQAMRSLAVPAIVVEIILIITSITVFVGLRVSWKQVMAMSSTLRFLTSHGWWIAPIGLVVGIGGCLLFRDICRWVFPRFRLSRASASLAAGALTGAILSVSYYPALASQISPRDVFDYYRSHKSGTEPLGLLGISNRTAAYYVGDGVESFPDVDKALNWLLDGDQRKWMAVRDQDLAKLNSSYRNRKRDGLNIPVIDSRSSEILLASNKLLPSDTNKNPLDDILLPKRPQPSRPLDAEMQDQIKAIGWDIVDTNGKVVDFVTDSRKYRLRLYYEVIGKISRDRESFVHIDGFGRRFNGDHQPMDKKYPMTLWQIGDVLVDDIQFQLEPNFTPGEYRLYFGFFVGNTRMKITKGKHQDDRIDGGAVVVR